jgi:hypothetical protein
VLLPPGLLLLPGVLLPPGVLLLPGLLLPPGRPPWHLAWGRRPAAGTQLTCPRGSLRRSLLVLLLPALGGRLLGGVEGGG